MPAVTISPDDLTPFADIAEAKASAMIADALGMATLIAPCITDESFAFPDAARAVIRGAILRWNDAGSGAVTTKQAGPYQQVIDANTRRNNLYWPSEITQLQTMCRTSSEAFTLDTAPGRGCGHSIWCSLGLGGDTCSCGAVLTNGEYPLWETDV
jgi:hypothetical protein